MSLNIYDSIAEFSTCEISDALMKLGEHEGGYLPDIHRVSPDPNGPCRRLCGPAYTVHVVLVDHHHHQAPKFHGHFVDLAPEGSVVFISAPQSAQNAVWGGLMTAGAQARGVVGAIVSGRVRDTAEHRAAGFPLFARGTSAVGQATYTRAVEIQVPLMVHTTPWDHGALPTITVHPGDILLADEDGMVCIPKQLEQQVLKIAKVGREVDARCLKDIQAGVGVEESLRRHRGS